MKLLVGAAEACPDKGVGFSRVETNFWTKEDLETADQLEQLLTRSSYQENDRERKRERERERVKRVIMVVKRAERKVSSQGVSFLFRPRLPQHRPSLTLGSPVGRLQCRTSTMQLTRLVNQLLDQTLLASKRTSLVVEKPWLRDYYFLPIFTFFENPHFSGMS